MCKEWWSHVLVCSYLSINLTGTVVSAACYNKTHVHIASATNATLLTITCTRIDMHDVYLHHCHRCSRPRFYHHHSQRPEKLKFVIKAKYKILLEKKDFKKLPSTKFPERKQMMHIYSETVRLWHTKEVTCNFLFKLEQ